RLLESVIRIVDSHILSPVGCDEPSAEGDEMCAAAHPCDPTAEGVPLIDLRLHDAERRVRGIDAAKMPDASKRRIEVPRLMAAVAGICAEAMERPKLARGDPALRPAGRAEECRNTGAHRGPAPFRLLLLLHREAAQRLLASTSTTGPACCPHWSGRIRS